MQDVHATQAQTSRHTDRDTETQRHRDTETQRQTRRERRRETARETARDTQAQCDTHVHVRDMNATWPNPHCEIKCEHPHSWYKVYSACADLRLISRWKKGSPRL
eukprot:3490014-Rhodomonas_salina.1